MPTRVWLTTNCPRTEEPSDAFVHFLLNEAKGRLREPPHPRYRRYAPADEPAGADVILFLESYKHKGREYVDTLLANEWVRNHPDRCFTLDFQPEPAGLLPGVYTSLPRRRLDPLRHRTHGYPGMHNPWPMRLGERSEEVEPDLLFSFRGSSSHPLRKQILEARFGGEGVAITQTFKWFDHDEDEKRTYAEEMLRSKFVLCPRGIATSSYRAYETMALGRVPVILADQWAPPTGLAWGEFSLHVSEDRIADLPDIIRDYEPSWREMGRAARAAWLDWFCPDIMLYRTLRYIEEIRLLRGPSHDERACQKRWTSWAMARENSWTLPQKVTQAVRSVEMGKRVRAKLLPDAPKKA